MGFGVLRTENGKESKEKFTQVDREKSVLGAIYIRQSSIPPSPAEPPLDPNYDEDKVTVIPLEVDVRVSYHHPQWTM